MFFSPLNKAKKQEIQIKRKRSISTQQKAHQVKDIYQDIYRRKTPRAKWKSR